MATAPKSRIVERLFRGRERESDLEGTLASLYRQHSLLQPADSYILEHQQSKCIANQVRTFFWYRPHLPERGAILDWGAYHSPDSCMLRAFYGDRFELHACDFAELDRHQVFHDFSRTNYCQLDDHLKLPYRAETFSAVIASGVLEHCAMDYESLKELYRILKPDGVLIISYLPNWLSLREWVQRNVYKKEFHRRLYGMTEGSQLLKRAGFYPETMRYHTFFWERLAGKIVTSSDLIAQMLKKIVPLQVFSSTLCFIARKVRVM